MRRRLPLAETILFVVAHVLLGCGTHLKGGESAKPPEERTIRVAVLSLGGPGAESSDARTLGVDVDAEMIAEFRKRLEPSDPDIVIVSVNAESDEFHECVKIADELEQIESKYRTVVWVQLAVKQAVIAIWPIDELYMCNQGNLGAAAYPYWDRRRPRVAEAFAEADLASAAGHRDPLILRSMMFQFPLSATRIGDSFRWFRNQTSGEMLINREFEVLCLDSRKAEACGVSKGTADNFASLCKLLGIDRYEFIASDASKRFADESEGRRHSAKLMNEHASRSLALVRIMNELASQDPLPTKELASARNEAKEEIDALAALAGQQPSLARTLGIVGAEADRAPDGQRWILPTLQTGFEEISRRLERP